MLNSSQYIHFKRAEGGGYWYKNYRIKKYKDSVGVFWVMFTVGGSVVITAETLYRIKAHIYYNHI